MSARHPIDRGTIAGAAGTPLARNSFEDGGKPTTEYTPGPDYRIVLPSPVEEPPKCQLPDLYEFLPIIVRQMDSTLVDRGPITLYPWDQIPPWDTSPYAWDDIVGAEPILKATIRAMQSEFEITAHEICGLKDLATHLTAPAEYLSLISAGLGIPLPSASAESQRTWIDNVIRWYRRKGTAVVFKSLFRTLGFDFDLVERYQRKNDGEFVTGPDLLFATSYGVVGIEYGTLTSSAGPYVIALPRFPIVRRSLRVYVYAHSNATPIILEDDGASGWIDFASGSVNHETGTASFTLFELPTNPGGLIRVDFQYLPDQYPDPYKRRWTNRYRSSYAFATLEPVHPSVVLTPELSNRLMFYLFELKPAHVIFEEIAVVLAGADTVVITDTYGPHVILLYDHLWPAPYHGHAYDTSGNGSMTPIRGGAEYLYSPSQVAAIAAGEPQAPYAYPWTYGGRFFNPLGGSSPTHREYVGDDQYYPRYDSTISNHAPPGTTAFTIQSTGVVPASLGVGAHVILTSGDLSGEWSTLLSATPGAGFYTIVVSAAFPAAPAVGDGISILHAEAIDHNGLALRPEDTAHIYFVESEFAGTGAQLAFGPGSLSQTPIATGHVLLRFTTGGNSYEEVDNGAGGFSNVSGRIASASVDYITGAVSVTFQVGSAPDGGTFVVYAYGTTTSVNWGEF